MSTESDESGVELKETGRIEAFSDGVFAIAITLLVLEIRVPRELPEGTGLAAALADQWPSYFALLTSFATIGIMWINHHRLFTLIKRSDQGLLVLNALLLLGVTVVPFPTALIAEYIKRPDAPVAALVYSGTYVFIAIAFDALWWYASYRGRLLGARANRDMVRSITRRYMFGPLYYLASCGLALVSAPASLALNLLLAVFWALPYRNRTVTDG
jgi:uncharacterized membrane protein